MPDGVLVALISAAASIVVVLISARDTQNKMQQQLKENQILTNNEIAHIKDEITEMKADIKEHNGYAKHMPVIEERLTNFIQRVERLEKNTN
jgi:uncharacterized protein (UPF0335 family)